jgi:hypothetical protein
MLISNRKLNLIRNWELIAIVAAVLGVIILWLGPAPRTWFGDGSSSGAAAVAGAGALGNSADMVAAMVIQGRLPSVPPLPVGLPSRASVESSFLAGTIGVSAPFAGPGLASIGFRSASESVAPERDRARAAEGSVRRGRGAGVLRALAAPPGDLDNATIRRTIGRKRGTLEACYWHAQSADPTLAGDVTFLVTVKQDGFVDVAVGNESPRLAAAGVTRCIKSRLEALDFSGRPPSGGDLQLRLPMSFIEAPPPIPPEI